MSHLINCRHTLIADVTKTFAFAYFKLDYSIVLDSFFISHVNLS